MRVSRSVAFGLMGTDRKQGITLVLVTMLLFAIYDALSKYLARHYPVPELLWVRYVTHVLLMLALFGPGMRFGLVKTGRPVLQIIRALLLVVVTFLFMNGLRYIPLADATAINFLAPLLVTALSMPMLREKVGPREWLAVILGFIGVLIIVRPGSASLQLAALFPLSSAVCYSFYQIITRKFKGSENPVTMHFYTGLVGVVASSMAWQPGWRMPGLSDAFLMICLGVSTGVGHYLLIKAFERMSPAVAAPFTYTHLVWAVMFGYLIFGEAPDIGSLLGIMVIVGSGLYVARHHGKQ
jgi:drug/metabolite transporter (DMT)-like permease